MVAAANEACDGPYNLGMCALDCDKVGGSPGNFSPGRRREKVVSAVLDLQQAGIRVIAIVNGADDPFAEALLAASSAVNRRRLLLHCRESADGAEVLRVARQFSCRFAWEGAPPDQSAEEQWRLPGDIRAWLAVAGPKLQERGALGSQPRRAVEELAGATLPEPDARVRACSAANWLAGGSAELAADSMAAAGTRCGADASGDADASIVSDGTEVCILRVQRTFHEEQLLCVFCEDARGGPFGAAGALASELLGVGGEAHHEEDNPDDQLANALLAKGGCWAEQPFLLLTVSCGQHAGLRAVGVGSNLKKRRRAASFAIAATAALHRREQAAETGAAGGLFGTSGGGSGSASEGQGAVKNKETEAARILDELVAAVQQQLQKLEH